MGKEVVIKPGEEGEYIMKRIKSKCTEDGDCLIWQGCCANAGYPAMTYRHKTWMVRRLVWLALGRTVMNKEAIVPTCDDPLCVAPEHLKRAKRGIPVGRKQAASTGIRQALRTQARSNLTPADVIAIRNSSEPLAVLVERYQKSKRAIQYIRSGQSWRNVSVGMWTGLMGVSHA